ncbi:hypothetical protein MTBBW1_1390011 [Desulfamplus magnetovallimortis]|uniref:Uncharacterized protein n=1 Tax=Desulfamplus magnetovallimortis TaxID=1246637 RepID=A0A1W1H7U3_9BACT|nr:hypothetical protein [Desulfamplus magnetovallimortis]SLM28551.1 hypothetical protein MTBBW1_1390011 [Desulfamplus magnetovallimortis]
MEQIKEFNSWVTYGKVAGNRISVDLPEELDAQEVQIIIIPTRAVHCSDKDEWKKDFQSISRWNISEEDIRMKSWPIPEY